MEMRAIARKWGNSLAVIIPKEVAESRFIRENDNILVDIKKPLLVKDIFGLVKGKITRPTSEIMAEIRAGWMSETDRKQEEQWKSKKK